MEYNRLSVLQITNFCFQHQFPKQHVGRSFDDFSYVLVVESGSKQYRWQLLSEKNKARDVSILPATALH